MWSLIMVTKVTVPVHEALQWKLSKGQSLYNALMNYALLELDKPDYVDYNIYVEGSEFIIEVEMGEK
jgi:hypothetical protein